MSKKFFVDFCGKLGKLAKSINKSCITGLTPISRQGRALQTYGDVRGISSHRVPLPGGRSRSAALRNRFCKEKAHFFVVVEKRGGFSVALPKEGEGEVLDRGVEAGRGSRLKKVDQYFP